MKGNKVSLNAITIALLAGSTILAACSGGSGTHRSGNSESDRVLAKTAGNSGEALEDEATLKASQRTSSGWTRHYDEQTATATKDTTATVKRNADGGLDLTVNGRLIHFTADDLVETEDGFRLADESAGLWAWNGETLADALDPDGERYSLMFDYYTDDGDTGTNGMFIVGTETDSADLAALPTAEYSGQARVRVAPKEGFDNYDDSVGEVRGDVSLTADFGAGKVSGAVTDLEERLPEGQDPTRQWNGVNGALTLKSTKIEGNGFSGGISANAEFVEDMGTIDSGSTYSGTFFGPGAEEVGGGISVSGKTVDGTPYLGFGVWQAYLD